jgi:hypothetical protein
MIIRITDCGVTAAVLANSCFRVAMSEEIPEDEPKQALIRKSQTDALLCKLPLTEAAGSDRVETQPN